MRIRYSGRVALLVSALIVAITAAVNAFRSAPEPFWPFVVAGLAAVLIVLVNLFFLAYGWAKVDESGVAYRGRYGGFQSGRFLAEGECLVIAGARVFVRKPDGTLEGTGLVRWMVAGRDWRRLEGMLPTVERGSGPVVPASRPTSR
ncbi:hypothetical protein AB0I28_11265 [Phytomonospora sp. NPDC050363]|uniref:hypothetical protein n=1 Tax=Phytomonospora sp. NPDC050363 TaxID=3155642 RepID=UPI0033F109B4